jgi:hypothetical protein
MSIASPAMQNGAKINGTTKLGERLIQKRWLRTDELDYSGNTA